MKSEKNILLIDKPEGITSFDVIRILRKKLGTWKMGHAGTLDPFATGLLIVGVGEGTKKMQEFLGLSKVYEAKVVLGVRTATGDKDGEIVERKIVAGITKEKIEDVLKQMTGDIVLPVPAYSAIKRQGKPLYEYAREGKQIDIPDKTMHVDSADLLLFLNDEVSIRWNVGSGAYIRSLAEDLGKRLGTVAHVKELRRISIGSYSINDAEKV